MMRDVFTECPICRSADSSPVATFEALAFVRCTACTLIYKRREASDLRERLSRNYEAAYFEQGNAQYLRRWNHRVRKCRWQLELCLEFNRDAKTLLDVGCSAGYVLEAGKQLGLTPTGMDISQYAVQLVRERGFAAEVGTLEQLPFADQQFDVVTAKHTLEHVTDPRAALKELHRVLRPGGVLLVVVPDADYWKTFAMPQSGRYFVPEQLGWQHHVYYTGRALHRALGDAGFTVQADSKAVRRRAGGLTTVRYAGYLLGTALARWTHTRRELHFVAQRSL